MDLACALSSQPVAPNNIILGFSHWSGGYCQALQNTDGKSSLSTAILLLVAFFPHVSRVPTTPSTVSIVPTKVSMCPGHLNTVSFVVLRSNKQIILQTLSRGLLPYLAHFILISDSFPKLLSFYVFSPHHMVSISEFRRCQIKLTNRRNISTNLQLRIGDRVRNRNLLEVLCPLSLHHTFHPFQMQQEKKSCANTQTFWEIYHPC